MTRDDFYEMKSQLNSIQYELSLLTGLINNSAKPERIYQGYDDLGKFLNVSKTKAYEMTRNGVIPSHKENGTIFFLESEVVLALKKLARKKR